jgi:hypothetical protein
VSTHKALETKRTLEEPRSDQTRVHYVSWIDLRRDADAVVSFKPVRVQHVDVEDTKWDFVRFTIESKFGIHSDGSGNGTVRDYVVRSRRLGIQNPFVAHSGVTESAKGACAWLLREDIIRDDETIVVMRWPLAQPFRPYKPIKHDVLEQAPTIHVSRKRCREDNDEDKVTIKRRRDEEDTSAYVIGGDDEDEEDSRLASILFQAVPELSQRVPSKSIQQHYGDLVQMLWTKPRRNYECKRCYVYGEHYTVACPHWDSTTNAPLNTMPRRITGIPKSHLQGYGSIKVGTAT